MFVFLMLLAWHNSATQEDKFFFSYFINFILEILCLLQITLEIFQFESFNGHTGFGPLKLLLKFDLL